MSNVSHTHDILPFTAGKSEALTGQRLAKLQWKTTKKNPAKYKNHCVSIPPISQAWCEDSRLIPYIRTMLEETQDSLIKSLFEGKGGNLKTVHDSEIDIDAMIAFLEAEDAGGRLTKEAIASWFKAAVSDSLYAFIGEKLGFLSENQVPNEDQDRVIKQHVSGYADVFGMLAGGATILAEKQIRNLQNALALIEEDEMSERLEKRLQSMLAPKAPKELIDLS
jgi:hypothetical protein